ncbi:MAG TPA: LD-carboxypeptidase, partial [Lacipirellulaceae bacterium]|nr:LD-carboxypeptidase [Lacipirellulaceae bacterium]
MMPTIKPRALKAGDTIGVVVPAGPLNRERIDRALTRVRDRGFRVKTYGDIYRSRGYLAGDDATRAAELMAAFADPETAAVWCARGGYGVMRMLHLLDFNVIQDNPKVFVGFSDITALHIPIQKRTGLITFHGPNLQDGFGKPDDMSAADQTALWRVLLADQQSTNPSSYAYDFAGIEGLSLQTINGGTATGELTGGNLAMLNSTMGTPDEVETTGRILFIEDVSEQLYRIDRYLTQLRLAGKFDSIAGVLVGSFSYDEGDQADKPSDITTYLSEFFANIGVPVLAGFPAGHDRFNLTLPMG